MNDFENTCKEINEYYNNPANFLDFTKLDTCVDTIYNILTFVIDENVREVSMLMNVSNRSSYIFNGKHINSACNTLRSIQSCCKLGCFSDSFVLIRKLRDDLFQYLSIYKVLRDYKPLGHYPSSFINDSYFDNERFSEMIAATMKAVYSEANKDEYHKLIDKWFENNLENEKSRRSFFDANKYRSFLSECIKKETSKEEDKELYRSYLKTIWLDTNSLLNNYTHANGEIYIESNYISGYNSKKGKALMSASINALNNIVLCFLCFSILINPLSCKNTIISDYLEVGLDIPEEIQYNVDERVSQFIETYYNGDSKGLKEYLTKNNSHGLIIS